MTELIERLTRLGFSEYEAKAYLALLHESPVTGYQLAKLSSVPRSMIYEVMGKLTARGAAMTLRVEGGMKYAPIPPEEFLAQLRREQEELVGSLQADLTALDRHADLDYVWHIEGHEAILAKAGEMLTQAQSSVYIALFPSTFPALREALETAVRRGVRVVLYTTEAVDVACCRVVVAHVSEETLAQARGLGLILVIDGEEVLVGEWLTANRARASWTSNSLLVFIAEHHLRTDLYLPQLLTMLGERAFEVIQEEDRELFTRALESECGR